MQFGIVGALGRMGRAIAARAQSTGMQLTTPVEFAQHPDLGKSYRAVTGLGFEAEIVPLAKAKIPEGGLIDFSHA